MTEEEIEKQKRIVADIKRREIRNEDGIAQAILYEMSQLSPNAPEFATLLGRYDKLMYARYMRVQGDPAPVPARPPVPPAPVIVQQAPKPSAFAKIREWMLRRKADRIKAELKAASASNDWTKISAAAKKARALFPA